MTEPISIARQAEIWNSPVGTELPDVGCQWRYGDYEDQETDKWDTYCGVMPSIKSEFYYNLCKAHLELARKRYAEEQEQRKQKRILITLHGHAVSTGEAPSEAIAYQIPRSKEPRFTSAFGRTWDSICRTDKDERIIIDTTWGHIGYFERNHVMYKVNVFETSDREKRIIAKMKAKSLINTPEPPKSVN